MAKTAGAQIAVIGIDIGKNSFHSRRFTTISPTI